MKTALKASFKVSPMWEPTRRTGIRKEKRKREG
jgi:hypothetical protein